MIKSKKEFYKELYNIEQNRKDKIDDSVQFPTTILTILIGAFSFVITNDKLEIINHKNFIYKILLVILIPLFISSLAVTIGFLLMMFHNIKNKYKYLPSPKKLMERQITLFEHYKRSHSEEKLEERILEKQAKEYSNEQFEIELVEYYIDCSENNQAINDRRLKEYYYSRKYLMFAIISLIILVSVILKQNIL